MHLIVDQVTLQQDRYKKDLLVLRSMLIGAEFWVALQALELAQRFHVGLRKDGVTPEFHHQVRMALHAMTLPNLARVKRENLLVVIFLHDTTEDYEAHPRDLLDRFDAEDHDRVRPLIHSVVLLDKYEADGTPRDEDQVFAQIAVDEYASLVKPIDRFSNLSTMNARNKDGDPVFPYPKQIAYAEFAEQRILPVLKIGRRMFPKHTIAYENIKVGIIEQIAFTRAIIAAFEAGQRETKRIQIVQG